MRRSTPSRPCPARVVVDAEAGALTSESPVHFGKRVVRLGSGLVGHGLAGASASVGSNLRPNQRFHLTWLSCAKTRPHALPVASLAKVLPRTRQAGETHRWDIAQKQRGIFYHRHKSHAGHHAPFSQMYGSSKINGGRIVA